VTVVCFYHLELAALYSVYVFGCLKVKNDQKQKTARFRLWGGRQLEGDS
jgi:hypothetical protein